MKNFFLRFSGVILGIFQTPTTTKNLSMSFTRFFEKFKFLDEIIARGSTGNQKNLAKRLGISVSTLNEYLSEMKQANFPIEYSRKKQTYYYSRKGRMVDNLFSEDLDKEQMKKIVGGTFAFQSLKTTHFNLGEHNKCHPDPYQHIPILLA